MPSPGPYGEVPPHVHTNPALWDDSGDSAPLTKLTKEQQSEKEQLADAAMFQHNLMWVSQYKVEKGCADCGFNAHPAALDFDHLPGYKKIRNVSQLMNKHPQRILSEIEKCEVVCSNCHRIRTAIRRPKRQYADLPDVLERCLKPPRERGSKLNPEEAADLLDRLGIPATLGKHKIQELVRAGNLDIHCGGETLLAAQKLRRHQSLSDALFEVDRTETTSGE